VSLSRDAIRAFAFESTFGPRDVLIGLATAWTYAESRGDARRIVKTFLREYVSFAPRVWAADARRQREQDE
jgi:hypothetical protein